MKFLQPRSLARYVLLLTLAVLITFSWTTCKKSGGDPIRIEGFSLYDYNGNLIGRSGPPDSDWTYMSRLSVREMALFDFQSNTTLDSTSVDGGRPGIGIFPNPINTQLQVYNTVGTKTVLKLVVVNQSLRVFQKLMYKIDPGVTTIRLDFDDRSIYPDKSAYRIYYSLSAKGAPDFKFGYGDIKICEAGTIGGCFP